MPTTRKRRDRSCSRNYIYRQRQQVAELPAHNLLFQTRDHLQRLASHYINANTQWNTFNVYFKMHVCYIDLSTNYILALRDVSLNTYTLIYRDCLLIRKQLLKHVKKITCITRVDRCTTLCQHTAVPTRGGNEVIPAIHERILQGRQDYGGSNSS